MHPVVKTWLTTLEGENGVREIGHTNRGKRVDEYQKADLLPGLGYAWCCSFLDWGFLTALGQALADKVWYRTASCDELLDFARRRGILSTEPIAGAAALCMASRNDATHILGVRSLERNGFNSVEGNTNNDGSREGNGVYFRFRAYSSRYLYVHWEKLLPAGAVAKGEAVPDHPIPAPFEGAQWWPLLLGEKEVTKVPLVAGHARLEAWRWAKWIGGAWEKANGRPALAWNNEAQTVMITGREVPDQPMLVDGRAWLKVSKMTAHNGLSTFVENGRIHITA